MKVKALLINFTAPYHVGWRKAEPIIDGLTLHRALVALHHIVYGPNRIELITKELRVSAVLPSIKKKEYHEPVLPPPPIPSKVRPKKAGFKWVTLETAINLVAEIAKQEKVFIENVENGRVAVKLGTTRKYLCIEGEFLKQCEENVEIPHSKLIEKFEATHNRVDRLTNSTDLFKVSAYRARSDMLVVFQSDNDDVLKTAKGLLELLGQIGLGGLRSRGFGKFVVKGEAEIDKEHFEKNPCAGYNLLLGSYVNDLLLEPNMTEGPLVDPTKSYINIRLLTGYSGPPQDTYVLPHLSYAGAGSIIYTKNPPYPIVRSIKTSSLNSTIVFNPVTIGCFT
ncbi:MAG: hypothetical protein QW459_04635 [Sulfolobales archaeon]